MCKRIFSVPLLLTVVGCGGPPPPEIYNDHLFDAIQTAITKKDAYWLDQYANRARACHETGQLTNQQYHDLESIIMKARSSNWADADREVEEFRRRQPRVKEDK